MRNGQALESDITADVLVCWRANMKEPWVKARQNRSSTAAGYAPANKRMSVLHLVCDGLHGFANALPQGCEAY